MLIQHDSNNVCPACGLYTRYYTGDEIQCVNKDQCYDYDVDFAERVKKQNDQQAEAWYKLNAFDYVKLIDEWTKAKEYKF